MAWRSRLAPIFRKGSPLVPNHSQLLPRRSLKICGSPDTHTGLGGPYGGGCTGNQVLRRSISPSTIPALGGLTCFTVEFPGVRVKALG